MSEVPLILSILSFTGMVIGVCWTWISAIKGQDTKREAMKTDIIKDMAALELRMSNRIGALETQVLPICALLTDVLKTEIPKWMHSPHTPEFDRLLEKMPDGLDPDELLELIGYFEKEEAAADKDYGKKLMLALEVGFLKNIYQKMECTK